MNQFGRALKLALAHRWNVVACIFTSNAVATLWAGNLTAVWPVIDVIMNDTSLPDWLDAEIVQCNQEVAENSRWLAQLEALPADEPQQIAAAIAAEIEHRQSELAKHVAESADVWNDEQIAEKTRLTKGIERLQGFKDASPEKGAAMGYQEERWAARQVAVYPSRGERFARLAPLAHRWLPTTPFTTMLAVCLFVLVGTVLKGMFRIFNGILVARIGSIVGYDLRMDYYRQVLRLDVASFTEKGRGDLMSRCTADLGSICRGGARVFGQALLEPLKMLACLTVAAWISWQLLLLTIFTAPLVGYAIYWLGRALKRTHRYAMQEMSSILGTLSQKLGAIKLIKG